MGQVDDEGWVTSEEPYMMRVHCNGGPLDGDYFDILWETDEQAGFGPTIDLQIKQPPWVATYAREGDFSDFYDAEGADTHIDVHFVR